MRGIMLSNYPCRDLSILKDQIPKSMVMVGNKPVMDWMLRVLKSHGLRQLTATVDSQADEIESYFGDGSQWSVRISYSQEPKIIADAAYTRGTANYVEKQPVVVLMGGILADMDIRKLADLHRSKGAVVTIGITQHEYFGPRTLYLDEDSNITTTHSRYEQRNALQSCRSCGVYVFEPRIFESLPETALFDLEKELLPRLLKNNQRVCGYMHSGYWIDINTIEDFKQANFDFLDDQLTIRSSCGGAYAEDGISVGTGTKIHDSVLMRPPVSIGNDCVIREDARLIGPAVIGDSTIIDKDVSFQRAIIWGRGYIGRDSCVNGAIIGDSTYISSDVEIHDKAVIGLNCIVGPHSLIQDGAVVSPGAVIKKNSSVGYLAGNQIKSASEIN